MKKKYLQKIILTNLLAFFFLLPPTLSSSAFSQETYDPIESVNRKVFWFNDKVDNYLMEPISKGYTKVTPRPVRKSIGNFFENLRYPVYLVSDVTQGKLTQAASHTGRFILNSTFGVAGLFDIATDFGLEQHSEDFGSALGYYDVPEGPYLMLPFLGPSNLRDFSGKVVDFFLHPFYWIGFSGPSRDVENTTIGLGVVDIIDIRASYQSALDAGKEASIDYYSFLREAYTQRRLGLIHDGMPPEDEFDDFLDEEDEFDEEEFVEKNDE